MRRILLFVLMLVALIPGSMRPVGAQQDQQSPSPISTEKHSPDQSCVNESDDFHFECKEETFLERNKGVIILIAAVACFFALYCYFTPKARIRRKLKNTDRKDIADVEDNQLINLGGIVKAATDTDGGYLVSPLGQRKCIYYRVRITEEKSDSHGDSYTKTLVDESDELDFELQDDTGVAFVEFCTNLKRIHVVKHLKDSSGLFNPADPRVTSYLTKKGFRDKSWAGLFNRDLEIAESAIEIGEQIAVVGMGHWEATTHTENNESAKRLVVRGDNQQRLLITDDPNLTNHE